MKKVLAIAPYAYLPWYSGGQKFIARFFEWLAKEVELVVISVPSNNTKPAVNYRLLPYLRNSFFRYADRSVINKLVALVQNEQPDVLICEHPYLAWLCFAVRKKTGVPVIIHTHNIEHARFRSLGKWWWPILRRYEKQSFKNADGLFFISPEDQDFAVKQWKIDPAKCLQVPFGIETNSYPDSKASCRQQVIRNHSLNAGEKILLFNGLLNYKPNIEALRCILEKINPLLHQTDLNYKIIICGKGLPAEFNELKAYEDQNIIYAGFVDDIDSYFQAADTMLNPVQSGGGVKTKLIEAIAHGTTVVSTITGAIGVERKAAGDKLVIVPNNDWSSFASAVMAAANIELKTPSSFYETYYWGNIIKNVTAFQTRK